MREDAPFDFGDRAFVPLLREEGIPPTQIEYKLRRMVNDYLQPPKVTRKMEIALERFDEIRAIAVLKPSCCARTSLIRIATSPRPQCDWRSKALSRLTPMPLSTSDAHCSCT